MQDSIVPRDVYRGPIARSGGDLPSWKSARTKPILPDWQFARARESDKRTQSCQNGGLHSAWTVESATNEPTGYSSGPDPRERTQWADDRANEPSEPFLPVTDLRE
jgi:hypothetical protein